MEFNPALRPIGNCWYRHLHDHVLLNSVYIVKMLEAVTETQQTQEEILMEELHDNLYLSM